MSRRRQGPPLSSNPHVYRTSSFHAFYPSVQCNARCADDPNGKHACTIQKQTRGWPSQMGDAVLIRVGRSGGGGGEKTEPCTTLEKYVFWHSMLRFTRISSNPEVSHRSLPGARGAGYQCKSTNLSPRLRWCCWKWLSLCCCCCCQRFRYHCVGGLASVVLVLVRGRGSAVERGVCLVRTSTPFAFANRPATCRSLVPAVAAAADAATNGRRVQSDRILLPSPHRGRRARMLRLHFP